MIKNIQSLMDKSKNFAKDNELSVQEVLQNYMFERFLERLSKSNTISKVKQFDVDISISNLLKSIIIPNVYLSSSKKFYIICAT